MLGDIGIKILKEVNIDDVDINKYYPRTIRGEIHQKLFENYGEIALYNLGVEQFVQAQDTALFSEYFNTRGKGYSTNTRKELKTSKMIDRQRLIREKFIIMLCDLFSGRSTKKKAIIAINDKISCFYKLVDKDKIKIELTNAVFYGHQEFNRGSLLSMLNRFLCDYWDINAEYIEKESEYRKGLSKTVFLFYFKYRNVKVSKNKTYNQFLDSSKTQFLRSVLNLSEKQKIFAIDQTKKIKKISKEIGKYIPPEIHKGLIKGIYGTEITTKRKKLTIFFSDIKNFTDTSEKLQPEDLTKYLNEYFSEMTTLAMKYGATIDKYIGDAVMLFFGDPNSKGEKEDARACVEMSINMQEKMVELRKKWKNEGFYDPFQIRIGLNTGYCNVGNFGSSQRLTYTIIGGEVNVAARLEAAGDAGSIFMSYETYAHVQDMVEVEEKQSVKMKGIKREIKVFSVTGRKRSQSKFTNKVKENSLNNSNIKKKEALVYLKEIKELKKTLSKIEAKAKKLLKN